MQRSSSGHSFHLRMFGFSIKNKTRLGMEIRLAKHSYETICLHEAPALTSTLGLKSPPGLKKRHSLFCREPQATHLPWGGECALRPKWRHAEEWEPQSWEIFSMKCSESKCLPKSKFYSSSLRFTHDLNAFINRLAITDKNQCFGVCFSCLLPSVLLWLTITSYTLVSLKPLDLR